MTFRVATLAACTSNLFAIRKSEIILHIVLIYILLELGQPISPQRVTTLSYGNMQTAVTVYISCKQLCYLS